MRCCSRRLAARRACAVCWVTGIAAMAAARFGGSLGGGCSCSSRNFSRPSTRYLATAAVSIPNVTRPSHRSSPRASAAGTAGLDAAGTATQAPITIETTDRVVLAPIMAILSSSALPAGASERRPAPVSGAPADPSSPASGVAAPAPAARPRPPAVPGRVLPAAPPALAHDAHRARLAPARDAPRDRVRLEVRADGQPQGSRPAPELRVSLEESADGRPPDSHPAAEQRVPLEESPDGRPPGSRPVLGLRVQIEVPADGRPPGSRPAPKLRGPVRARAPAPAMDRPPAARRAL